jgi:hypothetical protein
MVECLLVVIYELKYENSVVYGGVIIVDFIYVGISVDLFHGVGLCTLKSRRRINFKLELPIIVWLLLLGVVDDRRLPLPLCYCVDVVDHFGLFLSPSCLAVAHFFQYFVLLVVVVVLLVETAASLRQ